MVLFTSIKSNLTLGCMGLSKNCYIQYGPLGKGSPPPTECEVVEKSKEQVQSSPGSATTTDSLKVCGGQGNCHTNMIHLNTFSFNKSTSCFA